MRENTDQEKALYLDIFHAVPAFQDNYSWLSSTRKTTKSNPDIFSQQFSKTFTRDFQEQPPELFCKNDAVKIFVKFTGKHLCHNLFFIKLQISYMQLYFKKCLWRRCFPVKLTKYKRTLFSRHQLFMFFFGIFWKSFLCSHNSFLNFLSHNNFTLCLSFQLEIWP